MLSFWGFLILLFLICFFRYFAILISVDYQYVTGNQQDIMKYIHDAIFITVCFISKRRMKQEKKSCEYVFCSYKKNCNFAFDIQ